MSLTRKSVSELRQEAELVTAETPVGTDKGTRLMDAVWRTAAEFVIHLSKKLAQGTKNDQIGLLPLVYDSRTYLKDLLKKPRFVTLEVSNVGVLDNSIDEESEDNYSKWTVEQAAFVQSSWVTGGVILVSCASVKGKGLSLNVTWQKEILPDDSLGLGIANDLHRWLECIANGQPLLTGEKQAGSEVAY